MFSHGWPLSADDWDAQLFLLHHGYRVIAHDRRGHGRSTQTADGHDMDHYADDLAALTTHLDLKNAIHVGHSTGGGEVTRYLGRHGEGRVAKAALISAVPPLMVKTAANPLASLRRYSTACRRNSPPIVRNSIATCRRDHLRLQPAGRESLRGRDRELVATGHDGRRQGALRRHRGLLQTDFTEDLKKITVPVLVMHGEDDQIVPYVASGPLSAKLLKNGTLRRYQGFPHGMPTTEADTINSDLLAFIKG